MSVEEKVLLIGGGWIGNKVKDLLLNRGYIVEVADLLETGLDIRKVPEVNELIANFDGDKVVLLAAISDLNVFHEKPYLGFDTNVTGVWNVAKACLTYKKHLDYISTCCVYGNTPELPSSETSEARPSEIYAACKLAGENMIKGLHESYGLRYSILRIATCYGPGMRAALAPAVFIKQIECDIPVTIHGNGEQTRTFTYIDDEVEGIVEVITRAPENETWNISTEEEVSVNEMVVIIGREMGKIPAIVTHPDRVGQTHKEQIDASKMGNILGWKAKTTFAEGIKKTLKYMR